MLGVIQLSEMRWRDAQTVVFLALGGEDFDTPLLVSIDRTSGAAAGQPLALESFPLSLSPDGTRVLIEIVPPGQAAQALRSRFDRPIRTHLPKTGTARIGPRFTPRYRASDMRYFSSTQLTLGVLDLRSGAVSYLLTLPENSTLYALDWTRDGNRIALAHTYLASFRIDYNFILGQQTTQDVLGRLPLAENPFVQNSKLDTFELGPSPRQLGSVAAAGGNGDYFADVSWSPDNQHLLAQMWSPARIAGRAHPTALFPERSSFRFYSADGQLRSSFERPEIGGVYSTSASVISPDEVLFRAVNGMSVRLFYYNRVSGEFRALPTPEGSVAQFTASRQSRRIVYNFYSFTQPLELYRMNWDGNALSALSSANTAIVETSRLRADAVSFTLANGQQRSGTLIQPAGASFPPQNVPIVVWQQGGPGVPMVSNWGVFAESPYSLLPNFGIAVLVVPLTGREGYGPAFYNNLANNANFGRIDIDEQAEIVRQLISRGYTSAGKVGIVGCSYGGYFTTQSIVRHPNLYAAANTQCSWVETIVDWHYVDVLTSYLTGKAPTDGIDQFAAISPLYNSTAIKTPLLIFHGTEDFQPIRLMQTFHDQLVINKVPVRMITFEGEGHGLFFPSSQLMATQEQLLWFRKYLAP